MDAIPLHLKRDKKRKLVKVKQDIESTNKILREDIYDLIKAYHDAGMSKEEAKNELRNFLKGLLTKAVGYRGDKNIGIERVVSDIDSYGFIWTK